MKSIEDIVMFIPACGWGERVKARGEKPFLYVQEPDRSWFALNEVAAMAPDKMEVEIALRREMGCSRFHRNVTVFFMDETIGQAQTIYRWLQRARMRQYVLISNCDNAVDQESILYGLKILDVDRFKGIVYTFQPIKENDTRWSYVQTSPKGLITQIAEKEPISKSAVAGVYLLNMFDLRRALEPDDRYLSTALGRMRGLYAHRVKIYRGWNDLEQIDELEHGVAQAI
jgi:hypothetical protein